MITTSKLHFNNSITQWDPINPKPPVTSTNIIYIIKKFIAHYQPYYKSNIQYLLKYKILFIDFTNKNITIINNT
ncbi:putative orfan [Tupanvirus soda lake]|uniref:Orfan n=1 Tax=Tupanvirus deep ocean TaxID=2126984 RepID=A0A2K9L7F3_9VIRU|nr:putative orfan [Tupanvirus soda lake]AUL78421.2 putative orfan [Tupanvirus soda lake]